MQRGERGGSEGEGVKSTDGRIGGGEVDGRDKVRGVARRGSSDKSVVRRNVLDCSGDDDDDGGGDAGEGRSTSRAEEDRSDNNCEVSVGDESERRRKGRGVVRRCSSENICARASIPRCTVNAEDDNGDVAGANDDVENEDVGLEEETRGLMRYNEWLERLLLYWNEMVERAKLSKSGQEVMKHSKVVKWLGVLLGFLFLIIVGPIGAVKLVFGSVFGLLRLLLGVLGLTVGLGLALGFAGHVHDTLEKAALATAKQNDGSHVGEAYALSASSIQASRRTASLVSLSSSGLHSVKGDEKSYQTLMARAGYQIPTSTPLRGQLLNGDSQLKTAEAIGGSAMIMMKLWSNLPKPINNQLSILLDLIVRDYIKCWFCKIDTGVQYTDPAANKQPTDACEGDKAASQTQQQVPSSAAPSASTPATDSPPPSAQSSPSTSATSPDGKAAPPSRFLVTSTAAYRSAPFIDILTISLAHLLGQISTVAGEHVNVMELVLIQVVKAIGKTLKLYRQMKKRAIERNQTAKQHHSNTAQATSIPDKPTKSPADSAKSQESRSDTDLGSSTHGSPDTDTNESISSPSSLKRSVTPDPLHHANVSEIAIAREFIISGRLHKAVTFGIDIPSLLFADPRGEATSSSPPATEDQVLHDRLFDSPMLKESELDYNRVLAYRLCRKLLPPAEFGSPLIRSFIVEVMAGCILTPVMGFFQPEAVNGWIVQGVDGYLGSADTKTEDTADVAKHKTNTADEPKTEDTEVTQSAQDATVDNDEKPETESAERAATSNASSNTENIASSQSPSPTPTPNESNVITATDPDTIEIQNDLIPEVAKKNEPIIPVNELEIIGRDNTDTSTSTDLLNAPVAETTIPENTPLSAESLAVLKENEAILETAECDDIDESIDYTSLEEIGDGDVEEDVSLATEDAVESSMEPLDDLAEDSAVIADVPQKERSESFDDSSSDAENKDDKKEQCDHLLPILTLAVVEVENFVESGKKSEDGEVDWDNSTTKQAVTQLVLVIEEALKHGQRSKQKTAKNRKKPDATADKSDPKSPDADAIDADTPMIDHVETITLSVVLMDMTMDIAAFEKKMTDDPHFYSSKHHHEQDQPEEEIIAEEIAGENADDEEAEENSNIGNFLADETATLRTLIAAWLQTGDVFNAIRVFSSCKVLIKQFYHSHAFLRSEELTHCFVKQLKLLHGVDILVDTMAVLSASGLMPRRHSETLSTASDSRDFTKNQQKSSQDNSNPQNQQIARQSSLPSVILRSWTDQRTDQPSQEGGAVLRTSLSNMKANIRTNRQRLQRWVGVKENPAVNQPTQPPAPSEVKSSTNVDRGIRATPSNVDRGIRATPHHLDFHKNQAFAASLRAERERRMDSWRRASIAAATTANGQYRMLDMVHNRATRNVHREMHGLARSFYTSTVAISIGGAAAADDGKKENGLQLEAVSGRRMIDVPDDDSSFLLRAQPRPLEPLGIHVERNHHDQSYKCYATTYEEPVTHPFSNRYNGGRYIRQCVLKYYPSDRTANITVVRDSRHLRRGVKRIRGQLLSEKIQKDRNLCLKANPRGSAGPGIMMSNVMEPSDFNSMPRTGKAIDFVYRMSLFEKPMIELAGKKFMVTDGSKIGAHRADASSLELSDASVSIALLLSGDQLHKETSRSSSQTKQSEESDDASKNSETKSPNKTKSESSESNPSGKTPPNTLDECPLIYVKITSSGEGKKDNNGGEERRGFRPSFIRAALMVASSRQEAQLQCLIWSVRRGSARRATRARTEALLQPTLNIIDFANSLKREKESVLLRDLKFGINHIDKEQLRRNGVLHPRYPVMLRGLNAKIEGWHQGIPPGSDALTISPMVLYKIRCVALSELMVNGTDAENEANNNEPDSEQNESTAPDENIAKQRRVYRVEWVVMRPFRDFITLHKHLKSEVAAVESSQGAGPRLAAAAAGVFAQGAPVAGHRHRKGLIPSLSAATKAGALAVTKKATDKRKQILGQYLGYLLSRNHLLKRCPELLCFLGADEPLLPELGRNCDFNPDHPDALGRTEIKVVHMNAEHFPEVGSVRKLASSSTMNISTRNLKQPTSNKQSTNNTTTTAIHHTERRDIQHKQNQTQNRRSLNQPHPKPNTPDTQSTKTRRTTDPKLMAKIASIKSRVERVHLSHVRDAVFEFIRYQFDLDNATFFRSRLVSALRTMSFVVTNSHDFNKILLETHLTHINGNSIAEIIGSVRETIWPDGVFYTPAPPLEEEEKKTLEKTSKDKLSEAFPDQLRRLLGQEITQEGLDLLHEMLQNRIVVKSLGYMIMDMLWQDIFPDLGDFLSGTAALDFEE